jgi:hypothetical protein
VELFRRHTTARRWATAISVVILALGLAGSLAPQWFVAPERAIALADFAGPVSALAGFVLFLTFISFTEIRFKSGGLIALELQSLHTERKEIQERIAERRTPDVLDTIQLSLNQLSEYYTINKSQARSSFRFSVSAVVLGWLVLLFGVWRFYMQSTPNIQLTALTTIAGILSQFIGAAYFYLYRKTHEQLSFFFTQLVRMQDTMLAVRLAKDLPDLGAQTRIQEVIIQTLLSRTSSAAMAPSIVPAVGKPDLSLSPALPTDR